MAVPSDHACVYQDILFGNDIWRTVAAATRGRPKPIGWALHNPKSWKEHITKRMDNWTWNTSSTIADVNDVLAQGMRFGRRTVPGRVAAAMTTTRRDLEQKLRKVDNDEDRKAVLRQLWTTRKQLRAERERNKNAYVLEHLRQGGWGKRDMQKSVTNMMRLRHDNGDITIVPEENRGIGKVLPRDVHPRTVKRPEGAGARSRAQQSHQPELRLLAVERRHGHGRHGAASSTGMPGAQKCADDGVVAEAWGAATAADPRVCAAFAWTANQRLANNTENTPSSHDDDSSTCRHSSADGETPDEIATTTTTTIAYTSATATATVQNLTLRQEKNDDHDHDNNRDVRQALG